VEGLDRRRRREGATPAARRESREREAAAMAEVAVGCGGGSSRGGDCDGFVDRDGMVFVWAGLSVQMGRYILPRAWS
jgi:hypothetical protein